MMDLPIYYRWVFDPSDGSVTLSHNGEDHPANIKYHTDLGQEANNAFHGYVYRIGKGWRIFDWENQPVDDPYVIGQVIRRLRQKEGPVNPHPHLDDWTEVEEPNYDEFHYGLPVPKDPPGKGGET